MIELIRKLMKGEEGEINFELGVMDLFMLLSIFCVIVYLVMK